MNVHLIDGTYELFRAHFARPLALESRGPGHQAAAGLMGSLLSC